MRILKSGMLLICALLIAGAAQAEVKQYGAGTSASAWGITACPAGYLVGAISAGGPSIPACIPLDYTYVGIFPDFEVQVSTYPGQTYLSGALNDIYSHEGTPTATSSVCIDSTAPPAWKFYLCNPVVVNDNATSVPTPPSGTIEQYVCADITSCYRTFYTFAAPGEYVTYRADGTNASPSALGAGEPITLFAGRGWDGSAWSTDLAGIRCLTGQIFTSAHHGSGCGVYVTPNNSTTQFQAWFFEPSGGLVGNNSSGSAPTGGDCGAGCLNVNNGFEVGGAVLPGTVGTTFTVSGCGTAGSKTGGAAAGSFTIGTGASSCTFTVTINGATGSTAPHGWIANADDVTKAVHCTNSTTVSATTVVFVCGGTPATSDVVEFSAVPY